MTTLSKFTELFSFLDCIRFFLFLFFPVSLVIFFLSSAQSSSSSFLVETFDYFPLSPDSSFVGYIYLRYESWNNIALRKGGQNSVCEASLNHPWPVNAGALLFLFIFNALFLLSLFLRFPLQSSSFSSFLVLSSSSLAPLPLSSSVLFSLFIFCAFFLLFRSSSTFLFISVNLYFAALLLSQLILIPTSSSFSSFCSLKAGRGAWACLVK